MDYTLSPADAWEQSLSYQNTTDAQLSGTSKIPSGGFPDTAQVGYDQVYSLEMNPIEDVNESMSSRFSSWLGNIGDTVKTWDQDAGAWVIDEVKGGYKLSKDALSTVIDDVSKPLSSLLDSTTNRVIIMLVVVGVVLYIVGKGGAIGQAASYRPI